jgi:hypothetical protein
LHSGQIAGEIATFTSDRPAAVGEEQLVWRSDDDNNVEDWSSDGQYLLSLGDYSRFERARPGHSCAQFGHEMYRFCPNCNPAPLIRLCVLRDRVYNQASADQLGRPVARVDECEPPLTIKVYNYSPTRITQIMNPLHLAAPIQEEILHWPAGQQDPDPSPESV